MPKRCIQDNCTKIPIFNLPIFNLPIFNLPIFNLPTETKDIYGQSGYINRDENTVKNMIKIVNNQIKNKE